MHISALQAAERLSQPQTASEAEKLMTQKFLDRCRLMETLPRYTSNLAGNLAFDYANPIMDLADILKYSDFPDDQEFYEKLFSFSDPRVLVGFRSCISQSISYLKRQGNQLYEVPEDDYAFFREYIFIAFI